MPVCLEICSPDGMTRLNKQNKSSQTFLKKSSMLKNVISKQNEGMILCWSQLDLKDIFKDIINNYEFYMSC